MAGVPVFGDHPVAETLVELLVSGKLAADADPYLRAALIVGIAVDPCHQRRPDAPALHGGIDRDPAHVQTARLAVEPQAADRSPIHDSQGAARLLEIFADGLLGFGQRAARWIKPVVILEGELRQPVNLCRGFGSADSDIELYQLISMSMRPRARARWLAQRKAKAVRMTVAAAVRTSRPSIAPSERPANICSACGPRRLRRMSSIQ